jgi:uncharacterized membrane protein
VADVFIGGQAVSESLKFLFQSALLPDIQNQTYENLTRHSDRSQLLKAYLIFCHYTRLARMSVDTVKTVVGKDLYGYIKKPRLENLLQELFGRKIDVFVSLLQSLLDKCHSYCQLHPVNYIFASR